MDERLLAWFRDDVVTPIVRSVLTPDELDSIDVTVSPAVERPRPWTPPYISDQARVWVEVTAGNGTERFRLDVLSEAELYDVDVVRERVGEFASRFDDWVCETRFAWGQQRVTTVPDIVAPAL